jgi:lipoprotein-anchoring transpeptidase ErfK/SrfK
MTDRTAVSRAIIEAKKALQKGDRRAARRWAEQAVFLGRDVDEAWLILAQTCSPRARAVYLEQALKINPGSPEANAAMHSAKSWFNPAPNHKINVWNNISEEDVQEKSSDQGQGRLFWVSVLSIFVFIGLAFVVGLSLSVNFRNGIALSPRNTTQTISMGEEVITPTPTRLLPIIASVTPLQPATPSPAPTSTLAYIFIPALANFGAPAALPTSLSPLTTTQDPTPTSIPLGPGKKASFSGKMIIVDISDQHVYAYEGKKLIFSFIASTGRNNSTQEGRYKILDKIPNAYSYPWGFWMPYWMGIYYVGYDLENGFHSLPVISNGVKLWSSQIGSPITYGCVVLRPNDMKALYYWAGIGTDVLIRR